MNIPEHYIDDCGKVYDKPNERGWTCIEVLEFLKGKPYDAVALAYIHSLRPSYIRVTKGMTTLDARTWRVTVYINEDNTIRSIKQEVEVALPDGVAHGQALGVALKYGLDSEQVKWYIDVEGYLSTNEGYFKQVGDEYIKFPETKKD